MTAWAIIGLVTILAVLAERRRNRFYAEYLRRGRPDLSKLLPPAAPPAGVPPPPPRRSKHGRRSTEPRRRRV